MSTPEYYKQYHLKNKGNAHYRKMQNKAYSAHYARRCALRCDELQKRGPCEDCGLDDVRALDFHHVGPKDFPLSGRFFTHKSLDVIYVEIDKCIVLCASCHRIRHAEERACG